MNVRDRVRAPVHREAERERERGAADSAHARRNNERGRRRRRRATARRRTRAGPRNWGTSPESGGGRRRRHHRRRRRNAAAASNVTTGMPSRPIRRRGRAAGDTTCGTRREHLGTAAGPGAVAAGGAAAHPTRACRSAGTGCFARAAGPPPRRSRLRRSRRSRPARAGPARTAAARRQADTKAASRAGTVRRWRCRWLTPIPRSHVSGDASAVPSGRRVAVATTFSAPNPAHEAGVSADRAHVLPLHPAHRLAAGRRTRSTCSRTAGPCTSRRPAGR